MNLFVQLILTHCLFAIFKDSSQQTNHEQHSHGRFNLLEQPSSIQNKISWLQSGAPDESGALPWPVAPTSSAATLRAPNNLKAANSNHIPTSSNQWHHSQQEYIHSPDLAPQTASNSLYLPEVRHESGPERVDIAAKPAATIKSHIAPYQREENLQEQAAPYLGLPSSLGLALRQASGDESVFQPSPSIGSPRHTEAFDWLTQAPAVRAPAPLGQTEAPTSLKVHASSAPTLAATSKAPGELRPTEATTTSTARPPVSTTTSETTPTVSSDIGGRNRAVPGPNATIEPLVLSHQNSIILGPVQQKEYQTNAKNTAAIEFSNQVIYEGPVTASPAPASGGPADDYYFSATAKNGQGKNNNNYQEDNEQQAASNAWWAIGAGDEFERASNLTREDYLEYCDKSPLLINNKQRSLCRMHHRVMPVVARGIKMAIDECQARFAYSRWNCSLMLQHSSQRQHVEDETANQLAGAGPFDQDRSRGGQEQIFGDVMRQPNRERSFLNAIFAAALAHAMTKACSQGEMPEECSCDRKIKSKNNRGRIEWVACSDDIDYGARFSRDFTDNFSPNELDTTATIYMHNNEVGRRVFKSATDITCTCLNGENGLCQTKRCWKHLGSFADVVEEIMKRYEAATHVQRSNKDPHKLRPVRRGVRKPKRKDLVYINESPDYCRQDLRIGVLGTQNRSCNSTSQGPDNCSLLCCGRGFQRVVEYIEEDCNCKFVWCCQVKCDRCKRHVTNDICN